MGAPRPLSLLAAIGAAAAGVACGGDTSGPAPQDEPGAGVGALGGSAATRTLARARLDRRPAGRVAWVADAIRLEPGETVSHTHELVFAYARDGEHALESDGASETLAEGDGAAVEAGARHRHRGGDEPSTVWEIRLAPAGSPPGEGARRVFESEPLEGIPAPAEASFVEVTVPPRGGRTTVHTHPGPEFVYQLSGRIDYQNAIVGTRRLGPGGAEAIPPGTPVQKRNPFAEPAVFLSWFLVDPERPFAQPASFE